VTSARPIVVAVVALLAVDCSWEHCDLESINFQLPAPGDAIEIRIEACTERRDGSVTLAMDFSAHGTPTAPLALVVDGIQLQPQPGMRWLAFGEIPGQTSDEDCAPGKVITLRRLDADPAIEYRGSLSVDMSAPPLLSCHVTISVKPL
jgi:hypothetical protein